MSALPGMGAEELQRKVEEIIRTGVNPDARSIDDLTALINKRLGRQVDRLEPDEAVG